MKTNNEFQEGTMVFNEGILHVKYHQGIILDEHVFMKEIRCRKALTFDQTFFMLLDMSQAADITEGGLLFAAENPSSEHVLAIGVVTRPGHDHTRARLYSVFDKPNIPTRPFLSVHEAKEWFQNLQQTSAIKAA